MVRFGRVLLGRVPMIAFRYGRCNAGAKPLAGAGGAAHGAVGSGTAVTSMGKMGRPIVRESVAAVKMTRVVDDAEIEAINLGAGGGGVPPYPMPPPDKKKK